MSNILGSLKRELLLVLSRVQVSKYPMFFLYRRHEFRVTGNDGEEIYRRMRPGDIVLRGHNLSLTSRLLGEYSHIGIISTDMHVIHAVHPCVRKDSIHDFIRCDRMLLLRPTGLTADQMNAILHKAEEGLGMPYDFDFNFHDTREMACSEFIGWVFADYWNKLGIAYQKTRVLLFLTKQTLLPVHFATTFTGFTKVLHKGV